eukprot:TRINITY_DN11265_c0_g1_i1.p1 TRINITY_DN11265_c0_g1~~TRINITY_DN11265_c0_g1_i1.p1  ORF type:complete len:410 (-),score=87.77 TRINITY_DN11265_c0_g1_i1:484-1713(-)
MKLVATTILVLVGSVSGALLKEGFAGSHHHKHHQGHHHHYAKPDVIAGAAPQAAPPQAEPPQAGPAAAPMASPAASPGASPGPAPASAPAIAPVKVSYGNPKCPCIGLSIREGTTEVRINDKVKAIYPADFGASCQAWDNDRNPVSCKDGQKPGKDNGWCAEQWCYVDPCNCELDVPATKSPADAGYLPHASYQGKGVWYSYATCGGKDHWMDAEKKKKLQKKPAVCNNQQSEAKWGQSDCRCIGLAGQPGQNNITSGDIKLAYPADLGSECKAWDLKRHPECKVKKPPSWCSHPWCFVDPCKCRLEDVPKLSAYLPTAKGNRKSVYFSYHTCGVEDEFSFLSPHACVSLKTKEFCKGNRKCAWTGKECLGRELVEMCDKQELVKSGAYRDLEIGLRSAAVLSALSLFA